ncbi:flap structure-specific endonuclease, partial [Candidatus Micrarchaeota archaeon CG06_land_8_20_14_3_00_50_6]
MGVDLGDIIPAKETELGFFSGKTLAVDAFNTIYQFLASTRQYDGTLLMDSKGRVTSHLSGLFYRNLKLIKGGIRLCYVFDGKPPEFKDRTI